MGKKNIVDGECVQKDKNGKKDNINKKEQEKEGSQKVENVFLWKR